MKVFIALYVLFLSANCAPMFDDQWSLFKQTYKKQYGSIDEDNTR